MKNRSNTELEKAAQMIIRLAELHGVSENDVRADLMEAMKAAKQNTDPLVQERWRSFSYAGEEPTADEFLAWVLTQATGGMSQWKS